MEPARAPLGSGRDPGARRARLAPGAGLVALTLVAFVSLGLPDGLLGVAWPSMRSGFGLPLDALGLFLLGATAGYLTSSFLNGWLVRRLGVGRLLGLSSLLTCSALLGYTLCPWWPLMPALALLAGLGAGAIDAGLNAWVEAHLAPHMMQWLHASFGIGVTLGPAIMTAGLASTGSWRTGYRVVALCQLAMGIVFLLRARLWDGAPKAAHWERESAEAGSAPLPFSATLREPRAWLSALLFLAYSGVELGTGHWAYSYLSEGLGLTAAAAGLWTSAFWASFTAGRIAGGLLGRRVAARRLLSGALAATAAVASALAFLPLPAAKPFLLALLGLSIAPIFAGMVSTTSERVGRAHAANAIGMQMSLAGLGAAALPGLMGVAARRLGLAVVPMIAAALAWLLLGLEAAQRKARDR